MAIKLSFSKISTYVDCPRKYFLSYICNLGTGSSPHMSNGSAIHLCCEHFPEWPKEKQNLEELLAYYFKVLPEIDKDNLVHELIESVDMETGEILKELVVNPVFEQKAMKALHQFYYDYTENKFQHVETGRYAYQGPNRKEPIPVIKLREQWFNFKTKDGHEIRGVIDRVDDEIGGEHIVDYKSGQSRTPYKSLRDPLDMKSIQLSMYSLVRYKETGKIPVKTSFFYLEPAKDKKVEKGEYRTAPQRTVEELERVETFLNDIGNEMESATKNYDFPIGDSPNCYFCDFRNKCDILAESEISDRKNAFEIENKKDIEIDTSDWD
jgi:ATP-dependent helicase/DNAse subunit B